MNFKVNRVMEVLNRDAMIFEVFQYLMQIQRLLAGTNSSNVFNLYINTVKTHNRSESSIVIPTTALPLSCHKYLEVSQCMHAIEKNSGNTLTMSFEDGSSCVIYTGHGELPKQLDLTLLSITDNDLQFMLIELQSHKLGAL